MGNMAKRWELLPPAPQGFVASLPDIHSVLAHALYHRGLRTQSEVRDFLDGRFSGGDPFRLPGMHKAVSRLRQAIKQQESICVYGDFDADGVAACALLVQSLTSLGARAIPYIPHRIDEGYGLNKMALDRIVGQSIQLVVTVDCGIRSVEEVAHARRRGLEVIITDHHSVPAELPPALAVVSPRLPDSRYPEKNLSGVGVAYKLSQALLRVEGRIPVSSSRLREEELLDLVALGTVTDLAPLGGENRALVKQGLIQIRQANGPQRPGLRALLATAGIRPQAVDTYTIGYIIGPRLNAAGRLGDAGVAYQLLMANSQDQAQKLAQELEEKNSQRQSLLTEVWMKAREQVLDRTKEPLLWAVGPDFQSGVVGLAAARLTEEFYRPAVVVELGEIESRGSCRSVPEFNITLALDQCRDLLVKYGGHSSAAGFTVKNEDLLALEERLRKIAAKSLAGLELLPSLTINAELSLKDLEPKLFIDAQLLEPLGVGNPPLTILSRGVEVREAKTVGESHLKLILSDGRIV